MVAYKRQVATKLRRLNEFETWRQNHLFVVYPLPQLPPAEIVVDGKISVQDYYEIKRNQHRRFSLRGVKAKLASNNIFLVRPDIHNPNFVNGRLASPFAEAYVRPIFSLIQRKFCSRCKVPYLRSGKWLKRKFLPPKGQGRYHWLNNVKDWVWEEILSYMSLFDIGILRRVCMAFYRVGHLYCVVRCRGPLDLEKEALLLRTPE